MSHISSPAPSGEGPLVAHELRGGEGRRDHELEALWFSLCEPRFVPVTMIPVPGVDGSLALELARSLAEIGSWIAGETVVVVDASGIGPADVVVAEEQLERLTRSRTYVLVVVEAPTVEAAAVPILRAGSRSVLVVELDRSLTREIAAVTRLIAPEEVFGVVCVDPRRPPSVR